MRIPHRHLLLTLLLLSTPLKAADDFGAGMTAFQAGEYARALDYFNAARDDGREDDELLYNIAICHYRLGHWREANTLLADLYQRNPEQDLIAYNLAVTEKKLGHGDTARDLFLELALTSASTELAVLANRQYQLLAREDGVAAGAVGSRWMAGADVNVGTDDNVVDPTDLAGSDENDSFVETLVTARWYSDVSPNRGWVVDGYAYMSRYTDVDEYDIDMGDIGFKKFTGTDYGFWFLGGRADTSRLGGDGYLQSLSFNFGTGGQLYNGHFWNARYRYRSLASLSDEYDPLQGSNQRVSLDYGGRAGSHSRWKADYRYELDDRDDDEFEDFFTSYSAHRHTLGALWAFTSGDWRASLRGDYRYSEFLDDNLSGDGTAQGREDERYKLVLRGAWFFSANWSVIAEYSYTDNDSNIDSYDYSRQMIMLGMGWQL